MAADLRYLEIGTPEGATLAFGDKLLSRKSPGSSPQPALFTKARNQRRISRDEIFGPVVPLIRVADEGEALATADTPEMRETGMVNLPTAGVIFICPLAVANSAGIAARPPVCETAAYQHDHPLHEN